MAAALHADVDAAEWFVLANARLLERHRLAALLRGAPVEPVLAALRAYRNADGGFGHALEPDVRGPESEPVATLRALETLMEIGAGADPMVAGAAAWIGAVAEPDGGVPFVTRAAAAHPRAPWMVPSDGGSFLTFALAGALWQARAQAPWLARATEWCWAKLEGQDALSAYAIKYALAFLDHAPDERRARTAIERLRPTLASDGSIAVAGGTGHERLGPLALSGRAGARSRVLFAEDRITAELDLLARGQQDDGGWTFDWLAWSSGQSAEWRGIVTVQALGTLLSHGRIQR